MTMDLTGITNKNEYYTNHYFATVFEENAGETISAWNTAARESEEVRTPWSQLRRNAAQFYPVHDRYVRSSFNMTTLAGIRDMADLYLKSLGYPEAVPQKVQLDETLTVPVYLEMKKNSGAPLLWVVLMASQESDAGIMESYSFDPSEVNEDSYGAVEKGILGALEGEDLATKILFGQAEPPRFLMFIGMNQIALIDRNKWNEKRYLQFELEEIFSRLENTTLQAMSVLLHKDSLCPEDGKILLDELDEQSQRNASGVSQDLKYALRECIELLGNEVLYDMRTRQGRDLETDPVDAGQLTIECLRYMYRMLFVLFIEARPELGYAPMKSNSYYTGYSLESLRDIADQIREDTNEVGNGYYLHETLAKLYELVYDGYPKTEEELREVSESSSIHDMFLIAPLKAHIFDPEYTKMITEAKLRNSCMLRIVELMSLTKGTGKKNSRRGRISYANLGINQMGAVYEALLSYRGFIAEQDLYEVKRAGDSFNELDVGYFIPENELDQYTEDERVRYEHGENKGKLRMYKKGTFIYRLAGREREKSASYYTPEVLTKCLVKYALKELLEGKTADDILKLTVCEPAMGSAAFLNEAINQLAEAYITRKEQETGQIISYEDRFKELQKVKMYIADRNVYGIDLNPVAVELAEVSLWLNTIHEGGFVPWFGTQLVNGNSLIGARRQVYRTDDLVTKTKGMRWYEKAPDRVPLGTKRMPKKQVYHFLLGDPGMCKYNDSVIKSLEPENIKKINDWNKKFNQPYTVGELNTLLRLSAAIDNLWNAQVELQQEVERQTQDNLSIFGHKDTTEDSHTTIREKDRILSELYKSEHLRNAGPYARLKFAMDYWCSLWFWPIDKADLLPSRSEFLFDMSLILEGTIDSVDVGERSKHVQRFSLFATELEQMANDLLEQYGANTVVDIPGLRQGSPRLDLAYRIAEQNHFMHWELEFADLFAKRGGFDLVIGNPPWVKLTWEEKGVLSDSKPMFAVRKLSATDTAKQRTEALSESNIRNQYLAEYISISSEQNYINSKSNYAALKGLQGNLYECFLPQAWIYTNSIGVFALIHPESVFNDSSGTEIRKELNKRLRSHFRFSNALKLFADVHTSREFGLNVYSNKEMYRFDQIVNLYAATTVDECYSNDLTSDIYIKDESGKRNLRGQRNRITTIGKEELQLFARMLDDSDDWKSARLMSVYSKELIEILRCFDRQPKKFADLGNDIAVSMLWDETNAQKDGTIVRNVHFGQAIDTILSGAHIGTANPLFNCSNKNCKGNNDNTSIDLTEISSNYLPRTNYSPNVSVDEYIRRIPVTPWKDKYTNYYRLAGRKMIDIEGERTLMPALIPPSIGHTNGIIGFAFKYNSKLIQALAGFCSLPYDFFIKVCGKGNLQMNTAGMLPMLSDDNILSNELAVRVLLLNCLTNYYASLWESSFLDAFTEISWTKEDKRLPQFVFSGLTKKWRWDIPLRSAYSRRQAMVELDVLVAMSIGMNLDQLLTIYRVQFPTLQQHERDTYYDNNGRIAYAKNNALNGVGVSRTEFENEFQKAAKGEVLVRTVIDDTLPGGPKQRSIEYVAPFDRCDRERDYEIAWKFFEERYGGQNG